MSPADALAVLRDIVQDPTLDDRLISCDIHSVGEVVAGAPVLRGGVLYANDRAGDITHTITVRCRTLDD